MPLSKKQKAVLIGGGLTSLLGVSLIFSKITQAIKYAIVKGKIVDEDTGEPIPGVKITIDSYETTTLIDGTFEIPVAPGTYTLSATLINYETKVINITVPQEGLDLGQITLKRIKEPTRMPAYIKFEYLEYNLNKYFKYETEWAGYTWPCILGQWNLDAVEYKDENATEKGQNEIHITLQVLDDGYNPIPSCSVDIWTSTEDQYGTPLIGDISWGGIGAFYFPADTPLTLKTDDEGKIILRFKFLVEKNMLLSLNPVYKCTPPPKHCSRVPSIPEFCCVPEYYEWGPPASTTLPHAIYAALPFAKQINSVARVYVNVKVW